MALVDRSGTIATGGTAQSLMIANPGRVGFMVQNISAGDLWVNEVGGVAAAAQPAIKIPTGTTYISPIGSPCPTGISIFGATSAQAFVCREW